MAEKGTENPTTGTDISKAQSQQQPPQQAKQQPEPGEQRQFETGEAEAGQPDQGLQGDTLSQQRTDVEGASLKSEATGEAESGFVGAEGQQDTSSELIDEEEKDFVKDGQGAPEGK